MGDRHGKGEYENYEDGTKETGQWDNGRLGEFECYDKSGTLTHRKIYDYGELIKCEEVKQQI